MFWITKASKLIQEQHRSEAEVRVVMCLSKERYTALFTGAEKPKYAEAQWLSAFLGMQTIELFLPEEIAWASAPPGTGILTHEEANRGSEPPVTPETAPGYEKNLRSVVITELASAHNKVHTEYEHRRTLALRRDATETDVLKLALATDYHSIIHALTKALNEVTTTAALQVIQEALARMQYALRRL